MTSLISPILREGKFVGIAGADITLNELDSEIKTIQTYHTGYAFLVSNSGIFISAPDTEYIGVKTLASLAEDKKNPDLATVNKDIKARKSGYIATIDPFTGKQVFLFYAPVNTSGWSLVISAPTAEIMASVDNLRNLLILVGIIGLAILVIVIYLAASGVTRPIIAVSLAASQVAQGDLNVQISSNQQDEVGQMVSDFQNMVNYLRGIAQTAQKIAQGDLTETITPNSERDVLG